jgi:hypothetical protein
MLIDKSNDKNISSHTVDYYEALASQEQEYLDEIVEKTARTRDPGFRGFIHKQQSLQEFG